MNIKKNSEVGHKLIHKLEIGLLFTVLGVLAKENVYFSDSFNQLMQPGMNSTKITTIILVFILSFWCIRFFKRKQSLKNTTKKTETPDLSI